MVTLLGVSTKLLYVEPGSGVKPRPKTNLVQFRAMKKPLVEIILSTLKWLFRSKSIQILQN